MGKVYRCGRRRGRRADRGRGEQGGGGDATSVGVDGGGEREKGGRKTYNIERACWLVETAGTISYLCPRIITTTRIFFEDIVLLRRPSQTDSS